MKLKKILLQISIAPVLMAALGAAALDFTITGSTAFRSIAVDRTKSLFDSPGPTTYGDGTATAPGTFSGTMSNQAPSLGSQVVNMRLSFSGSGTGMQAVDQGTPVPTADPNGTNANMTPDIAFSDIFPESADPSLNGSDFNQVIVGVIPFEFVCNNTLAGVTNITREQALLLLSDSGIQFGLPAMPASYLGQTGPNSTNVVWLTGRTADSGTRITVEKNVGSSSSEVLWAFVGGNFVATNGMTSGGLERATIANGTNAIGYLGLADAANIAASAFPIQYEGVKATVANVQSGQYALWGYEHVVNKVSTLSSAKLAVQAALLSAVTNSGYQNTNTIYTASFADLANMKVNRGTDGGAIKSNNF
ncbi:MAG: hypothetical protein C5B50_23945 [Verrucomicrobia bacterium]|nr:MAG: hypothetical protein C5B50_23945 [Verrucomicrobiota bacterium]